MTQSVSMKRIQEFALLHYAKVLFACRAHPTMKEDEVPTLFLEPDIKSGYRAPNHSWAYYFASIFHVTNETVNIWSHLIGFMVMLYQFYSYALKHDVWLDERRRIVQVFNFCCVVYTLLSAIAHAVHSKSDVIHYTSLSADYGGVGLYTYGTGIMVFYLSGLNESYYTTLEPVFLPLNTLMAWFCCLSGSIGKLLYDCPYPFRRKLWNIGPVGCQLLLCTLATFERYYDCFHDSTCSMSSMTHYSLVILFFCSSIFFYASHLPEKIWPGKFDIVGQGHQIFHVLIVITSCLQVWAADIDIQHLRVPFQQNLPSWPQLIFSLLAIFLLDFFTILVLAPFVQRKVNMAKKDKES